VLRNPLDTQTAKTPGIALGALFGAVVKPPEAAPRPRRIAARVTLPPAIEPPKPAGPVMVEVINGAKRQESKFSATPSEGVQ